ncbi:beta-ketothiolase BktB [Sphingobium soli]|uniref:Beta-ketothiolase BktB n=1 Tax=Sphingobium soli TaxID=1591116 RepID=A0ABS8H175_9SPHN|nr:beta-ketothiolase BktB [Sphingobium soli]MCC4232285.1 beta-ketothiolase BktB [Sphingobium soli]
MSDDILILSGVRTAIGTFGGALKDVPPAKLGSIVIAEAMARAGIEPADVDHVFMGQVIPTIAQDAYLARVAALGADIPVSAPALTMNRLCGSGVQAIISAAQTLRLGEAELVVAGGAENMSRAPHLVASARFGQKMGPIEMVDALTTTLSDPLDGYHMGVTAENIAAQCKISREDQDALALESQRRAARAIAEGRFNEQIVPVEVSTRKGVIVFDTDEHVRGDTTAEGLTKLRPAFQKEGTVTAGNASGVNDGAAALVLATAAAAAAKGLVPRARILGWGHAGVDPSVMGLGPVKAVPIALERAGIGFEEIDVIEANEAFAAQACAVARELEFDPEKTNVNGSGISLGHPIGATGAILVVKAIHELERSEGRYGLITMCIGGGQGIALVIERFKSGT